MRRQRRSAGADVLAEAYRLLDALLGLEERAFSEIDQVLVDREPLVRRAMRASSPEVLLRDQDAWTALMHAARLAVEDASAVGMALMHQATEMSVESVADQLLMCEQTLGAKYEGLTETAMGTFEWDDVYDDALEVWAKEADAIPTALTLGVRDRLTAAVAEGETLAEETLFGRGSPMGAWWSIGTGLKLMARTIEFDSVNLVRTRAMEAWNVAAGP